MVRRPTLALALLSALTGCVSAPPNGPLVEYRHGLTPTTRPVECAATYALVPQDGTGSPVVRHRAARGERLGFRREADGSLVAVAPGYTCPLPPGAYAWEAVRATVPPWRERLWSALRGGAGTAARLTETALVAVAAAAILCGLLALAVYAERNTSPPAN